MKRYLQPILVILILGSLTWLVPTLNHLFGAKPSDRAKNMPQPEPAPDSGHSADDERVRQTVTGFLSWYRDHLQEVSEIPFVNQSEGEPYSVNLKNSERYLTLLKSSHGLTDAYLDDKRTYFKERQQDFHQHPQDEGPPIGFDIDLVTLNQDVDMQLAALDTLKMSDVSVSDDEAVLRFTLIDDYEIRLVWQDDRWLIDKIINRTRK